MQRQSGNKVGTVQEFKSCHHTGILLPLQLNMLPISDTVPKSFDALSCELGQAYAWMHARVIVENLGRGDSLSITRAPSTAQPSPDTGTDHTASAHSAVCEGNWPDLPS